MFDTLVLGVDPGIARLGMALVGRRDRRPALVWARTERTDPGTDEASRLLHLAQAVRSVIREARPEAVAVERIAWNRNQVSALSVARAIGVVTLVAAESGLPVAEYAPTEVKSAVAGSGSADKEQIRAALVRVHGLRDVPSDPDAADAVAVALTHLVGARLRAAAARVEAAR